MVFRSLGWLSDVEQLYRSNETCKFYFFGISVYIADWGSCSTAALRELCEARVSTREARFTTSQFNFLLMPTTLKELWVNEFVYLGSLVTADNDTILDIQTRIQAGNLAYFGLRKTLPSDRVSRRKVLRTIYQKAKELLSIW